MASTSTTSKKQLLGKTLLYGAITAALYAAAFTHTEILTAVFAKGGVYAALPIATVFVFSFAHGSFSSNLWSMLGIEAISKAPQPRAEQATKRPTQRKRPRLRMSV
ncbi:MAG: hypothetical protein AB7V04_06170 [Desulfomonilaceae bacterium]